MHHDFVPSLRTIQNEYINPHINPQYELEYNKSVPPDGETDSMYFH